MTLTAGLLMHLVHIIAVLSGILATVCACECHADHADHTDVFRIYRNRVLLTRENRDSMFVLENEDIWPGSSWYVSLILEYVYNSGPRVSPDRIVCHGLVAVDVKNGDVVWAVLDRTRRDCTVNCAAADFESGWVSVASVDSTRGPRDVLLRFTPVKQRMENKGKIQPLAQLDAALYGSSFSLSWDDPFTLTPSLVRRDAVDRRRVAIPGAWTQSTIEGVARKLRNPHSQFAAGSATDDVVVIEQLAAITIRRVKIGDDALQTMWQRSSSDVRAVFDNDFGLAHVISGTVRPTDYCYLLFGRVLGPWQVGRIRVSDGAMTRLASLEASPSSCCVSANGAVVALGVREVHNPGVRDFRLIWTESNMEVHREFTTEKLGIDRSDRRPVRPIGFAKSDLVLGNGDSIWTLQSPYSGMPVRVFRFRDFLPTESP